MFDAHTHCDRVPAEVLERAQVSGIRGLIVAGVDPEGWVRQAAMAQPWVWHAFGLHPWRAAAMTHSEIDEALSMLTHHLDAKAQRTIGLGETGLDRSKRCPGETLDPQIHAFRAQVTMAIERNLPLILHVVRAHDMAARILSETGLPSAGGMVHSFSGAPVHAQSYVDLGLHVSFSGSVTHPQAHKTSQAVLRVPDDRLLVETDSPDQTPYPRRPSPNEPAFLIDVIAKVAAIRHTDPAHITKLTTDNAQALFGLSVT